MSFWEVYFSKCLWVFPILIIWGPIITLQICNTIRHRDAAPKDELFSDIARIIAIVLLAVFVTFLAPYMMLRMHTQQMLSNII